MRAEVELLNAFHRRRLRPGVPADYLTDRLAFSLRPPVRLAQCRRCSHVYRNPWERREALVDAYDGRPLEDEVFRELLATQRNAYRAQAHRLTAVAGRPGRGLEVGSYAGGFLAAAQDAGWDFEGVDISEGAVAFASRNGLTLTRGEISNVVTRQPFDAVAIWNTFEQLYDARSAVMDARRLLRDGGILALRIPNGGFYTAWRTRLKGRLSGIAIRLLAHNNLLSFPYRQAFTSDSVTCLLLKCGFEIIHVTGDTLVPIADHWTTYFGTIEERLVKRIQRVVQPGWRAPWVEVYARAQER